MPELSSMAGPFAALLTSFIWVLGSYSYTKLAHRYHPAVINFNRALFALPLFMICTLFIWPETKESITSLGPLVWQRIGWLSISTTSSYAVADILFFFSALSVGFATAQGIAALYPLWATLAGIAFLGEFPSQWQVVGLVMAILGTIIIVIDGKKGIQIPLPEKLHFLKSPTVGIFFAFGTSLFWALNSFSANRGGQGIPVVAANVVRMGAAMLVCLIVAKVKEGKSCRLFLSKEDYRAYLPTIILEAFVGGFCFLYGMTHSSISVGATLTSLSPVFAIPVSVIFFKESISWKKVIAILMVVLGGIALMIK